ncbi:short-chain dehydrogenase [Rhodobacteraceae bacterium WD3A24]|nr:short-chain dehydrogenase [Rhodobacteraceae bacterium WD3A24]
MTTDDIVQSESLKGQAVIITGASRGIGAAAARAFAAAGAHVGLVARSAGSVRDLEKETGGLALPCDVADYSDLARNIEFMRRRFGRIDALVNNAGVIEPIAALREADPAEWGRAIDINLKGVFNGMRAVLPMMRAQGGGTIVTVSSGAAHAPLEGWSAYCSSKAGAAMLTRAADLEVRGDGVRVMGLSPGTVATDMQAAIRDSGINPVSQLDWSAHIPPEWPARALVWMCTADADDFIGQEVSLRDESIRARLELGG